MFTVAGTSALSRCVGLRRLREGRDGRENQGHEATHGGILRPRTAAVVVELTVWDRTATNTPFG
jgi:hypothetical protein